MTKKRKLISCAITLGASVCIGGVLTSYMSPISFLDLYQAENSSTYSLIISTSNPVVNSKVKTVGGYEIWTKADSNSGVNWNYGDNKFAISTNGYIQTLTQIHGIKNVRVEMTSGSLELFHSYVEPNDLETPMYGADFTFNSTNEYVYTSDFPTRIRLRATQDSVVSRIVITFDCVTDGVDQNVETLDYGLENSYIDAGAIGRYASTTYVVGEGNVYKEDSKRSLKIDFKNTTNNYVSLNTERNTIKELVDENPDFTDKIFTLKAKFSDDIVNHDLECCAVGSSWTDSGYVKMNCNDLPEDGWYSYSLDFSSMSFSNQNSIIRINIKPSGINSYNKNTGYVLLDEIDYHVSERNILAVRWGGSPYPETIACGLENMAFDDGETNCDLFCAYDTTYGKKSQYSLLLKPGKEGKNKSSNFNWFVCLNPESLEDGKDSNFIGTYQNFTKGILSFDYKPRNLVSNTTVYLGVYRSWSENKRMVVTDSSFAANNGWYHFRFDLSRLSLSDGPCIRLYIGFDATDANVNAKNCSIYIDNIKLENDGLMREDYTLGWENMSRDTGWEKCNVSIDYGVTASDTSTNSQRLTFDGKATDSNQNFICLSPQAQGIQNNYSCNNGILEAKFKYSEGFGDKTIRLTIIDANWKAARYNIPVTALENGWYLLKVDLSNLPTPWAIDTGFDGSSAPIRIGFGFVYLNSSNKNDKTVWIDDVFLNNKADVEDATIVTPWQAYNTENVMLTDSIIANRNVSESKPLEFNSMKGGTDSTQLMLKANTNISSYEFRAPRLYNPVGGYIDASNFEVLVEKYIYCPSDTSEKKGSSYGWRGAGFYPDALVPMNKIIEYSENSISSNNEQGIWINCKVPTDVSSGTYTGYGLLVVNGNEYKVPMKVEVYNAVLDTNNMHNINMFDVWDDLTAIGEGFSEIGENKSASFELINEYYYYSINKHINPKHNRYFDYGTYTDFVNDFANYVMPNPKITTYRIPSDQTYDDIYGYLNALVNKNIEVWNSGKHVNFFDKAMFYLVDEPAQPTDSNIPAAWNLAHDMETYIKQAINAVKANSQVTNYPVIQSGLENVRNVMPMNCDYNRLTGGSYKDKYYITRYYPNIFNTDYIRTPCPTFDHLNVTSERNSYFSTFDNVWFYGCLLPNLPYPGFHIDSPLLGQRVITWMQYQYGIQGQLYYCTNMYVNQDDGYAARDVWSEPLSGGKCAGDGQLTYPGLRYGIFGPISSIRLETVRASYEDYECFYMIDHNLAKYRQQSGNNISSALDLISSETSNMYTGTSLNTRPTTFASGYKAADFNTFRNYLLEQLEYCF